MLPCPLPDQFSVTASVTLWWLKLFKSILHFKRTCLAAELKGLCQVSQQLLFARDTDEECPCSPRRGWLRGSPCRRTVPGSDGGPGFYSNIYFSKCFLRHPGMGRAVRKGQRSWPDVNLLLETYTIPIAVLERSMHLKNKVLPLQISYMFSYY